MAHSNEKFDQPSWAEQGQNDRAEKPELIFNCWLIFNECGVLILNLLVKEYLATGSRQDKWNMLCERALTDFGIAEEFAVPEEYGSAFNSVDEKESVIIPYIHTSILKFTNEGRDLFTDAINEIKNRYAQNPDVLVEHDPLYKMTTRFTNLLESTEDCLLYQGKSLFVKKDRIDN